MDSAPLALPTLLLFSHSPAVANDDKMHARVSRAEVNGRYARIRKDYMRHSSDTSTGARRAATEMYSSSTSRRSLLLTMALHRISQMHSSQLHSRHSFQSLNEEIPEQVMPRWWCAGVADACSASTNVQFSKWQNENIESAHAARARPTTTKYLIRIIPLPAFGECDYGISFS